MKIKCIAPEMLSMTDCFVILDHFLPFYPTPPPKYNNQKYQNFEKIKKQLKILSFYTRVPKSTIIWYMVPERSSTTEFFVILTIFCLFTPYKPEKSKFWKNEKNALRYHFTQVYQKSRSYAILLLIYGTWQM